MNVYTVVLFLHITAAVGAFAGLGPWLFGAVALRRARRVEQVRTIAGLMTMSLPVVIISGLLLVAAGLYMALSTWSLRTGWIAVALISLIVIGAVGGRLAESRLVAITEAVDEAPDGPLPASLVARIGDPILGATVQTQTAVFVGIIYLMTNKPGLGGSLLVMVVALTCGLASAAPLLLATRGSRRARPTV